MHWASLSDGYARFIRIHKYFLFLLFNFSDYERVISHHIQHDDYHSALEVLRKPKDTELYYKFSPVLMQHIPNELVSAWIEQGKTLDPKKLIPALVQYDHSAQSSQVKTEPFGARLGSFSTLGGWRSYISAAR